MKKLSVLIALALCLTIGGAYATWTFATATVKDATVTDIKIGMTVEQSGDLGTLTAKFEGYDFDVVPGTGNAPKLQNKNEAAELVITFTPSDNAKNNLQDAASGAIDIDVTISISKDFTGSYTNAAGNTFEKTAVIGLNDTHGDAFSAGLKADSTGDWTDNGDGSFSITIDSDTIMGWIKIADSTALTDYDNAMAYKNAVENGTLLITISAN